MKENVSGDGTNPSMQCLVCGKWKRLNGIKDGSWVQRFYPCTNSHCKYYGYGAVCTDCCKGIDKPCSEK